MCSSYACMHVCMFKKNSQGSIFVSALISVIPLSGGNGESVSIIRLVYYIVPVVVLIITV